MTTLRSHHLICGLLASTVLAGPVAAQSDPDAVFVPPVRQVIDDNGVNLGSGFITVATPGISIGSDDQGLSFQRNFSQVDTLSAGWNNPYHYAVTGTIGSSLFVSVGGNSIEFTFDSPSGLYVNKNGTGETLTGSGSVWTFTSRDGTIVQLDDTPFLPGGGHAIAVGKTITLPNKQKLTLTYKGIIKTVNEVAVSLVRLQSVQSSNGYMAKMEYEYSGTTFAAGWLTLTKVTLLNLAVDYCNPSADSCTFSQTWPSLTIANNSKIWTITDALNRTTTYDANGGITSIRRPGSASDNVTIAHDGAGRVTSVTRDGRTWIYSWSLASPLMTATVTNPDQTQQVFVADTSIGQIKSVRNELNKTTSFDYDSKGRLEFVTYPEGNKLKFSYDARGNVTEQRAISKTPGTPPDIVVSANYATTCTNALTCNKPITTTDARNYVTDYTYDTTHGGLLTVTSPAPTTGAVRPQTRFAYATKQAYYKNSSGSIVASGQSTYMLTAVSSCRTTASCSGGADEVKSTVDYGAQTAGTANNLLPVSVSSGSGDNSLTATQSFTYDAVGNATFVDGPLAGLADRSRIFYDAARQQVGAIGPDPDGAGSLINRAARISYNLDGQVTKTERGTTVGQSDASFTAFAVAETTEAEYDAAGLLTKQKLSGSGGTTSLTQFSYDVSGQLECTAVRMNTAVYSSLPSSACVLSTSGSFGPDMVTRNVYDTAGQQTRVVTAVGTGSQRNERTAVYSDNGQITSLTDAEGNKTTYTYDGFDRLAETRFPSTTKGSGATSNSYEVLSYDAAGNIVSKQLRGTTSAITFTYDALNRVTFKDIPSSSLDSTYVYDNVGQMLSASQPGATLTFTYDALGRNIDQTGPLGTATSDYDVAGRRTRLTYPGTGLYVDYDYLVTGEMTAIRENGATSGVGVLATYAYDNLGRKTSLTYGNGVAQSYSYDAVSRLTSFTTNLAGTANDLTIGTMAYDPANRIVTSPRSNDAYSWMGSTTVNRDYTSNGLNQYLTSGSVVPTYDNRGNLTSAGGDTYAYSFENQLKTATGSSPATLQYDPGMRLMQVAGSATTKFGYDDLDLIVEADGSNNVLRRYVFGDDMDEPLVWYEGTDTSVRRFMTSDELGSVIALSDGTGAQIGINTYDEFGIPGTSNAGRFQYTGQTWLPELGMYYYKARIYSPSLGRFLQTDPTGYNDGMNWYNYVSGDPLNRVDPLGLDDIWRTPAVLPPPPIVVTGTRYRSQGGSTGGPSQNNSGSFSGEPSRIERQRAINEHRRRAKRAKEQTCFALAVRNNAVSFGLNLGGAAIPGVSTAATLGKLGVSGTSLIYGAVTSGNKAQLVSGVTLGIADFHLTSAGPLASKKTHALARAVPVVGNFISAFGALTDIKNAVDDFNKCMKGK